VRQDGSPIEGIYAFCAWTNTGEAWKMSPFLMCVSPHRSILLALLTIGPCLFVWAGDADKPQDDFLAVIDVRPNSMHYGRVLTTMPIGVQKDTMQHHTQHEMDKSGIIAMR
jgi:hypothetical protein